MKTEIKREFRRDEIIVHRVYKGAFQDDTCLTAELKQPVHVKSTYPPKSVSSDLQDNPFPIEAFGFNTGKVYEEDTVRVTWIDVPLGSTVDSVVEQLNLYPDACIYKILSNRPILTDKQIAGISSGLTSESIIANSQAVRYPANHEKAGQLIYDEHGKVQYRQTFLSLTEKDDIDLRTVPEDDEFLSPELEAEVNGTLQSNQVLFQVK